MNFNINKIITSNGHLSDEGISYCAEQLIEGNYEDLPEELLSHIEECHKCKKNIFAAYDNLSKPSGLVDTEDKTKAKFPVFRSNVFKIAAAIIILFGLFVLIQVSIKNSDNKLSGNQKPAEQFSDDTVNNTQQKTDVEDDIASSDILAEDEVNAERDLDEQKTYLTDHFTPSEKFEAFVNATFRDDNDFELVKPEKTQEFKINDNIEFKWKTNITEPLTLIFYNNSGKEIFRSSQISKTSYTLNQSFSPGLYYYKLETEENILFFGKALFKN
ncbi:MAG: hypothetical protein JW894_10900 [Bacteroidales bacterium]|nr:hypothetical protein [Bacteroidales bacterium]